MKEICGSVCADLTCRAQFKVIKLNVFKLAGASNFDNYVTKSRQNLLLNKN